MSGELARTAVEGHVRGFARVEEGAHVGPPRLGRVKHGGAGSGGAFGGWGPTAGCAQFVAHSPAATAAAGSPPQPNPFVAAGGGMNPFVQQPSPPNGGLL